jgi:hypothetical protein
MHESQRRLNRVNSTVKSGFESKTERKTSLLLLPIKEKKFSIFLDIESNLTQKIRLGGLDKRYGTVKSTDIIMYFVDSESFPVAPEENRTS